MVSRGSDAQEERSGETIAGLLPQWTDADLYSDLDDGIRQGVQVLREAGMETFESCEGGNGHAYPEPTIRFHGDAGAGWKALGVLIALDFPIGDLRRTWPYTYGAPTGPYWEVTFTRKVN